MSDEQAQEIGSSTVAYLHERFRVDATGQPEIPPDLVDKHLSAIGNPSTMSSTGFADKKVPMHSQVAESIRNDAGWGDALISILRYAGNPEEAIVTIADRRLRLRRFFNALNYGMGLHPDLAELEIRSDLALLGLALDGLDVGVIRPLVRKPQGMGNRPPDTRSMQQFRVYVVSFAMILEQAGVKRTVAFQWVARELTAAGATALKPNATASPGFNAATVKKYYYDAMPGALEARLAAQINSQAHVAKTLKGDTELVARMIAQFVLQAQEAGEQFPPSQDYVEDVIRSTIADAAFQDLIP